MYLNIKFKILKHEVQLQNISNIKMINWLKYTFMYHSYIAKGEHENFSLNYVVIIYLRWSTVYDKFLFI